MISTLAKNNSAVPILEIIQHTQTILDRILFVAFAEDKGLLPENTLKSCYEDRGKWNPPPAWENFKGLFESIGETPRGKPCGFMRGIKGIGCKKSTPHCGTSAAPGKMTALGITAKSLIWLVAGARFELTTFRL